MADAYAKEFEKWLQGANSGKSNGDSVDIGYSNDEVDDYQVLSERDEEAPVLSNNHGGNSRRSSTHQCFQDEPPILEPVQYGTSKISDSSDFPNSFDKNSEDCNIGHIETNSQMKKVEVFNNPKSVSEPEKCVYNKVKESENIFDKFSMLSEGDDFPPPLIPSHEAHLTTVDANDDDSPTEKSYATLQNLSPDFCAMEADSTSEIMKAGRNNARDRRGRAPDSNNVGVECDSTCMLNVSPHVVSPGSNIESDNPNTPVSVDDNQTMSWNTFSSKETYTSLMPFSEQTHLDFKNNFMPSDRIGSLGVYHHDSGEWDRECPKLEAVMDVEETNTSKSHQHDVDIEDTYEPPILSVVPPSTPITPKMAKRKKRHTIDTMESLPRKQQPYSKDSCSKKSSCLGPSTSQDFSKSKDSISANKKEGHKYLSTKQRDRKHSKSCSRPKKIRERCMTLPIVDLISYGSHLSKDLYNFVVNSSQLSILQNRMHQLVSLLFHQLAPELNLMSPESSQFETLLKDLIHYLKEPGAQSETQIESDNSSKSSAEDWCSRGESDVKWDNFKTCSKDTGLNSIYSNSSGQTLDTDSDHENSPQSGLNEGSHCSHVSNEFSDGSKDFHHQHSSVFSSSFLSEKFKPDNSKNSSSIDRQDSMIPGFAQLSLNRDNQRVLKNQPSVLLSKNPSALHKNFCKLSCSTLQLLLPDLDNGVMKVLAESPQDLVLFIDSVIASNSPHVELQ